MIQKTINLYTIEELKEQFPKAYNKAHQDYVTHNDYMFLSDDMNNRLQELLKEYGIQDLNDTSKPGTKPTRVLYSLSCCQGDGAMFEGEFMFKHDGKQYTARVKHVGRYYHSGMRDIEVENEEGETMTEEGYTWEDAEKYFSYNYEKICKELEEYGYSVIEYQDSEEYFMDMCEANDYVFQEDGTLESK